MIIIIRYYIAYSCALLARYDLIIASKTALENAVTVCIEKRAFRTGPGCSSSETSFPMMKASESRAVVAHLYQLLQEAVLKKPRVSSSIHSLAGPGSSPLFSKDR